MDAVISWVKQIFILSILSNIIFHLMPSEKYEQYAKFVCGIIIAVACITPLIQLLNGNATFTNVYESILNSQNVQDLKTELKYAENDDREALIAAYQNEVASQIEEKILEYDLYPVGTEVVIDSDSESESYGTLQQINLVVSTTKEEKKSIVIDDVSLGQINVEISSDESENANEKAEANSTVSELKTYLANFYNLNLSNINISINGE